VDALESATISSTGNNQASPLTDTDEKASSLPEVINKPSTSADCSPIVMSEGDSNRHVQQIITVIDKSISLSRDNPSSIASVPSGKRKAICIDVDDDIDCVQPVVKHPRLDSTNDDVTILEVISSADCKLSETMKSVEEPSEVSVQRSREVQVHGKTRWPSSDVVIIDLEADEPPVIGTIQCTGGKQEEGAVRGAAKENLSAITTVVNGSNPSAVSARKVTALSSVTSRAQDSKSAATEVMVVKKSLQSVDATLIETGQIDSVQKKSGHHNGASSGSSVHVETLFAELKSNNNSKIDSLSARRSASPAQQAREPYARVIGQVVSFNV